MGYTPATNIDRTRTLMNVRNAFPNLRKPENVANVIFAALELNALDGETPKNRGSFESAGATSYGMQISVKLKVLNRKKAPRIRFLIYKRPGVRKPKTPIEVNNALRREREGLYRHLLEDANALRSVVKLLELPENSSVIAVRRIIENGDIDYQVKMYDDVVKIALQNTDLYDEEYDYYWMGYRYKSDLYWLSGLGSRLAARESP